MSAEISFLSPGFMGAMLVTAMLLGAFLPQHVRRWWIIMGGGFVVACIGALIGFVPWIGDMHVTGYSVMLLLAFVLAYVVTIPRARVLKISERTIIDMALLALIGGIIGSRIGEVIEQWPAFGQDANGQPLGTSAFFSKFLDFDNGGMVWYGGAILAGVMILILAKQRKLRLLEVCDLLMPAVLLALGTGRVGCFFNGCCFGRQSDAPWAIANPFGVMSHPTQLYETAACVILFAITWWWWLHRRFQGEVAFIGLMGYSVWRFVNEGLRGDTVLSTALGTWGITTSQAISLYLAAGGLILAVVVITRRLRSPKLAALGRDVPGSCHHQPPTEADPMQENQSTVHDS